MDRLDYEVIWGELWNGFMLLYEAMAHESRVEIETQRVMRRMLYERPCG